MDIPSTSRTGVPIDNEQIKLDAAQELTQKFLRGEMTFSEYSNEWYGRDDDVDNDEEDSQQVPTQLIDKSALIKKRRPIKRLSAALTGLMGEANIRFVRGERDVAEKMCYEIIRQVPTAPEPYQTLAQIYEHDIEKSLQFSLLAAHLSPPDATEWLRLAALSKQMRDIKQEMLCYSQAIKAEPQELSIHLKRLELLTSLEAMSYPVNSLKITRVRCYHKIVTSLATTDGATIMKYAKMAATMYHNSQEIERALEVMESAYKKCSSLFSLEDINLFLELLLAQKQFQTCIEVLVANAGVEIEAEIQTISKHEDIEEHINYLTCTVPNDLPIDLKCKLLIAFIHSGAFNLVESLLDNFLKHDVEKAGDLYMDLEEALSAVGQHELAFKLLEPLVKNTSFDLGAVWLKHAECLFSLGREDEAIVSYYRVLKHAPQHSNARWKLFKILEKRGSIDEALNVLQQDYKLVVNAKLLYEQCCVLKKYNKLSKYLEVGEALLSKSYVKLRHQCEMRFVRLVRITPDIIYSFRQTRGENPYNSDDLHFDEDETFKLSPQEEWDLYIDLMKIAFENKLFYVMQRMSFGAMMVKSFVPNKTQIGFYCIQTCILNKDYTNAYAFIRDVMSKQLNTCTLNLFNHVMQRIDDQHSLKILMRLFQKERDGIVNDFLKDIFLGNNYLSSGKYMLALKYYLEFYDRCKDPLVPLLIGITLLIMSSLRTLDKHHTITLQGITYLLKYQQTRNCDQEVYYNMGRAYQMLSINNLAISYYEKALKCPPVAKCETHGVMDLTPEIAYNLYVLYKEQSPHMARTFMCKYLVI